MCDRCEELQERVLQLEIELGAHKRFPAKFKLARGEKILLGILSERQLTNTNATLALWPDGRVPEDELNSIKVRISALRRKLPQIKIINTFGEGWHLSEEHKAYIKSEMISD